MCRTRSKAGSEGSEEMMLLAAVVKIASLSLCKYFFGCSAQLVACVFLVPLPGVEPRSSAVEVPSPSHWPARES